MLKQFIWNLSKKARAKRAQFFREQFKPDARIRILDIGSQSGENIYLVLKGTDVLPRNVYIADIDSSLIESGRDKFGYKTVLLNESEKLPFSDGFFDIVYCSSVIEHVTVQKNSVWTIVKPDFQSIASRRQKEFAAEIRRVGRRYFVQTPNKNFFIESHTWLPFVGFLPRRWLVSIMKISNSIWIKQTIPDFNLLSAGEMKQLFPDADIVLEKSLRIFVKSIMAVKK